MTNAELLKWLDGEIARLSQLRKMLKGPRSDAYERLVEAAKIVVRGGSADRLVVALAEVGEAGEIEKEKT